MARGRVDSELFYEFGRNFWFYGNQLGEGVRDWGFATGYAVVNRYYAIQSTGFPIVEHDGNYHNLSLPKIAATYFASSTATAQNTLGQNVGITNETGYNGSPDLAASLFRVLREHVGPTDYATFWQTLPSRPYAATATAAFTNFSANALAASALDFSFLFKNGWTYQVGGAGSDSLTAVTHSGSSHVLLGFAGDDTLTGTNGAESLFGDMGADTLNGLDGDDELAGGGGNDALNGRAGNDVLHGGEGIDKMTGGLGNDIYVVDTASDVIVEASASGNDSVKSSVTYTLAANVEDLTLTGTAAINGTGNSLANKITGNAAANTLSGLGGNDTLDGSAGADTLNGGTGNDIYIVDNNGDRVVEASAGGTDTVKASVTHALAANVEKLTLTGTGAINGAGNDLANTILGNAASNILDGGNGNDIVKGGGGNDVVLGGAGSDTLSGGAGSDKFMFDAALSATTNVDRITDFSVVYDTVGLDQSFFAALAVTGQLSAAGFYKGTAAHDADDRIIYDSATGKLYYDADGIGGQAQILFGQLTAGLAMTNADFLIVS